MKANNVSIRNRLLISNIVMVFAPLLVVVVLIVGIFNGFSYFLSGQYSTSGSLGLLSVYQLQSQANSLQEALGQSAKYPEQQGATHDGIHKTDSGSQNLINTAILESCQAIEARQAQVAIIIDNEMVYLSTDLSIADFWTNYEDVSGKNTLPEESTLLASDRGSVFISHYAITGTSTAYTVILAPELSNVMQLASERFASDLFQLIDRVLLVMVCIAIFVILLLDGLLVFFFNKHVVHPLRRLQIATNEVRTGNLNHPVGYSSKNELGQLCEDFELMRLRLLDSENRQKRLEESRKDIIAGISHDLGTPLTSIKGYASGLLDGIADTPEKQTRYLETIYKTADDLDKLVGEFAMFSRLDMDVMPFYFEIEEAFAYIDSFGFELTENFAAYNIRFTSISNHPQEKVYIRIDHVQMRRVISNLMDNSIKYRRPDISNSVAQLVTDITLDNQLRIVLESNGNPVTEEDCQKIFDTFYRSSQARADVLNGSGLGLAVCRMIIERHGGSIIAKPSTLGGLAIEMLLPIVSIEGKGEEHDRKNLDY